MGNHKFGRRDAGGYRDFGLRMLIPSVILVLILLFLGVELPGWVLVTAMVIAEVTLLAGGAVSLFAGIRGPSG